MILKDTYDFAYNLENKKPIWAVSEPNIVFWLGKQPDPSNAYHKDIKVMPFSDALSFKVFLSEAGKYLRMSGIKFAIVHNLPEKTLENHKTKAHNIFK